MPRPVHRNDVRRFLAGLVTVAVMSAVAYVAITAQGGGELPGKSYTYVKATFENVGVLRVGQPVDQNGYRVGQVSALDYQDGVAIVTMRLDGERVVHADASAHIGNDSALGRKKIGIDLGSPDTGPLGDRPIPLSRTSDSIALDDVLSTFDKRTREALSSSLIELGGGVAGHSEDLHDVVGVAPEMLDGIGDISGALSSEEADLPALLASANRLVGRFEGRQREVSALIDQLDTTFRAINVDGTRPLNDTIQTLPATLRQARQGLKSLNEPLADVRSAVSTIRPGGHALGESAEDLRGFLRESVGPLGKVPTVGQKAIPAVKDLTHTVADARPLVPRVATTLTEAAVLLNGLAPYATDIGRFVSEHDLLSGQIAPNKHFFSAQVVIPGLYNASLPDPMADTVPYPEPGGGAWRDNPASGGNR